MEEVMKERRLLYYDVSILEDCPKGCIKFYNSLPVNYYAFRDIRTDEVVIIGENSHYEELIFSLGGSYYKKIENALDDFDIVWGVSKNGQVNQVSDSFEIVQATFKEMISDNMLPQDINLAMMEKYNFDSRIRK